MRRAPPMAPDLTPDTAAGPAGAGGAAPAAPAAEQATAAAPKPEPKAPTPTLRERLAEAKTARTSQLAELERKVQEQAQETAKLRAELEAERAASKTKGREAKLKAALAKVEIDPDLHDVVLPQFAGLDVDADGWEAKIDAFAKAHPRLVKTAPRTMPPTSWVEGATKALGDRTGRTLLGSMDADTLAGVLARRP